MLGAALALQSSARASLRRARERPEERSKEQLQARKDIHLYTCALKETVEPQNWYSADLPLATRRTLKRLGLQYLTETQAKFLRVLPWWRRRIFQAFEESRDTFATLCESQRKSAEKLLRKKFHWLFAHGKKGIQQILGKCKPPSAMEFVTQTCPCGIQWTMDGSNTSASVQQWVLDIQKWLDPTLHSLHVEMAKVSITRLVLTDLYPMIQRCLQSSPFPTGGPPTLLYGQGPWSGENLCTALEFFFQNNAYHPQASCDKCGHTGCVPLSVKVPPAAIAGLPREVGSRGNRDVTGGERTLEHSGES
jgi:hypothetical protein